MFGPVKDCFPGFEAAPILKIVPWMKRRSNYEPLKRKRGSDIPMAKVASTRPMREKHYTMSPWCNLSIAGAGHCKRSDFEAISLH